MFFMKKGKFLNRKNVNRKWLPQKFILGKTLFGKSWKLLILLTSFLFGNLFGINFSGINWNFSLIFFIVLFFECLNFLISRNFVSVLSVLPPKRVLGNKHFFGFETMKTVLESFRRGFLLGIFVEAFKVGS